MVYFGTGGEAKRVVRGDGMCRSVRSDVGRDDIKVDTKQR